MIKSISLYIYTTSSPANKVKISCKLVEIYEDECVLIAPSKSYFLEQEVKGKLITIHDDNQNNTVIFKGYIISIESNDNETDHIVIKIEKIDLKKYEEFIEIFHNRQEEIIEFISKAKGLEE